MEKFEFASFVPSLPLMDKLRDEKDLMDDYRTLTREYGNFPRVYALLILCSRLKVPFGKIIGVMPCSGDMTGGERRK
jgi:hypothetical protein